MRVAEIGTTELLNKLKGFNVKGVIYDTAIDGWNIEFENDKNEHIDLIVENGFISDARGKE